MYCLGPVSLFFLALTFFLFNISHSCPPLILNLLIVNIVFKLMSEVDIQYICVKLVNIIYLFILFFFFCFLRLFQLMEEIMAEKENKTIIFVETKKRCDDLTRRMRRDG